MLLALTSTSSVTTLLICLLFGVQCGTLLRENDSGKLKILIVARVKGVRTLSNIKGVFLKNK